MTIYRKDSKLTQVNDEQTFIMECDGKSCDRKPEIVWDPKLSRDDFIENILKPMSWGASFRNDVNRHYCPEHRMKPMLNNAEEVMAAFFGANLTFDKNGTVPTARVWDEYQRFLTTLPSPPAWKPGKHALFKAVREFGAHTSTKSIRLDGSQTTMAVFRGIDLRVTTPGDHLEWFERHRGAKIGSGSRKAGLLVAADRATKRRENQRAAAKMRYHGFEPKVALACSAPGCIATELESRAGDLGWSRASVSGHELYSCLEHTTLFDGVRPESDPASAAPEPTSKTDKNDELVLDPISSATPETDEFPDDDQPEEEVVFDHDDISMDGYAH